MPDPYLSEIRPLAFTFAPKDWADCDGQEMQISQYAALYSLLGIRFGGNGTQTFKLPDLRGRTPINYGPNVPMGMAGGLETVALGPQNLPAHRHDVYATTDMADEWAAEGHLLADTSPASITLYEQAPSSSTTVDVTTLGTTGASTPHSNMQPYLAVRFCISLKGTYPARN